MKVYAWLIDFAHFRKDCPMGIIPEWMQKVTRHNGIMQYQTGANYNKVRPGAVAPRIDIFQTNENEREEKINVSQVVLRFEDAQRGWCASPNKGRKETRARKVFPAINNTPTSREIMKSHNPAVYGNEDASELCQIPMPA